MSQSGSTSAAAGARTGVNPRALLIVLPLVGLLVYMLLGDKELPIERSAMGSQGLVSSLRDAGLEARYAGFEMHREGADLFRVLPVLDTDPQNRFIRPEDDATYLKTGTERDLPSRVLTAKTRSLPTLVIPPKWTRAARLSGYAHESLLLPRRTATGGIAILGLTKNPLIRPNVDLLRFRAEGRDGLLYNPQLFPDALDNACMPEVSLPEGHLVIRCEFENAPPLWAVSDPDLLNSHGLSLAQNAEIAVALIARMANDAPVLVDITDQVFMVPRERDLPRRSLADLARFFAYPFSLAWLGLAALSALVLWRSGVRFGPARRLFDDRLSASRAVSISAKARLLRHAGNDAALRERHIANRLRRIERALFGHPEPGPPEERILAHLRRSDTDLAAGFAAALAEARTTSGTLEAFEQQAGRVVHGS